MRISPDQPRAYQRSTTTCQVPRATEYTRRCDPGNWIFPIRAWGTNVEWPDHVY
jgi:hypothetical protein